MNINDGKHQPYGIISDIVNIKCFDEQGAYEVVSMAQFGYYNKDSLLDGIDKREQLLSLNGEDNPIIFCYEFKDQ
jgi:hypothetical protein